MAAAPGWYPDPDGTPGRFRYWDGRQWTAQTSAAANLTTGNQSPKRRGPIIIGAVVFLAVVLIVVLVVRAIDHRRSVIIDSYPEPTSSVSGWDDSSPLPTASPTRNASSEPSDSAAPQGSVRCAEGAPSRHANHPNDGRIYGGQLSFQPPPKPWVRDDLYAEGLSFAYDVSGAREQVEPEWWAMVAVGELHADDGFHTPKQAADGVLQCIASSFYYSYFTGRTDLFSKKITVDGHTGWALRSQIHVNDPDVKATGDVVEVIVLPTGTAGRLSLFAGFVPIGDAQRLQVLDGVIAGLRVT